MSNPRTRSRLLLALTVLWDACLVVFVASAALSFVSIAQGRGPVLHTTVPGVVVLFAWHTAMFLLGIGLLVTYAVHVHRNRDLTSTEEQLAWGLALFFAGPVAMPLYWTRHVRGARPRGPDDDTPTRPST